MIARPESRSDAKAAATQLMPEHDKVYAPALQSVPHEPSAVIAISQQDVAGGNSVEQLP